MLCAHLSVQHRHTQPTARLGDARDRLPKAHRAACIAGGRARQQQRQQAVLRQVRDRLRAQARHARAVLALQHAGSLKTYPNEARMHAPHCVLDAALNYLTRKRACMHAVCTEHTDLSFNMALSFRRCYRCGSLSDERALKWSTSPKMAPLRFSQYTNLRHSARGGLAAATRAARLALLPSPDRIWRNTSIVRLLMKCAWDK